MRQHVEVVWSIAKNKVRKLLSRLPIPTWNDVLVALSPDVSGPVRSKTHDETLRRLRRRYASCREFKRRNQEKTFYSWYSTDGRPETGKQMFLRLVYEDVEVLRGYSWVTAEKVWKEFTHLLRQDGSYVPSRRQ